MFIYGQYFGFQSHGENYEYESELAAVILAV